MWSLLLCGLLSTTISLSLFSAASVAAPAQAQETGSPEKETSLAVETSPEKAEVIVQDDASENTGPVDALTESGEGETDEGDGEDGEEDSESGEEQDGATVEEDEGEEASVEETSDEEIESDDGGATSQEEADTPEDDVDGAPAEQEASDTEQDTDAQDASAVASATPPVAEESAPQETQSSPEETSDVADDTTSNDAEAIEEETAVASQEDSGEDDTEQDESSDEGDDGEEEDDSEGADPQDGEIVEEGEDEGEEEVNDEEAEAGVDEEETDEAEQVSDEEAETDDESGEEYEEDEDGGEYDPQEGVSLTIPKLGTIAFAPSPEAQAAGKLSPEAQQLATHAAAQKAQPLIIADVIQLTDSTAFVRQDGNLVYTAQAQFLEKKATLRLKEFVPEEETLFELRMATPLSFTVLPGRTVEVETLYYSITPDGDELYTEKSIFTKDKNETRFVISLKASEPEIHAEIEQLELYKLIPAAKHSNQLAKISLQNIDITMPSPLFPSQAELEVIVEADATLEHLTFSDAVKLSNSRCTITMTTEDATFLSEFEKPITLGGVPLAQPSIELVFAPGSAPEILLVGRVEVELPLLGSVKIPVKAHRTSDGVEVRGALGKAIKFGPVTINAPELVYVVSYLAKGTSTKKEIRGQASLFGAKIVPVLQFITTNIDGKKKQSVRFKATFKDMPEIKPLEMVPFLKDIPGIPEFILKNAHVSFDNAKKMFLGGTSEIMKVATKTRVLLGKSGAAVEASLVEAWNIGKSMPELAQSALSAISLDDVGFFFASRTYFNHDLNQRIDRGLNIYGSMSVKEGSLDNVRKIFGDAFPPKVTVRVTLAPQIKECRFKAIIPFDLKLSDSASLHNIALEITGEPSLALLLAIKFIPEPGDPPLIFTGRLEFETEGATIAATMQGLWQNALGFDWLAIGDLALEVQLPYAIPPIPKSFGITGAVKLGTNLYRIALKVGGDEFVFVLDIPRLDFMELIKVLKDMGVDIEGLGIVDFQDVQILLEDLHIKVAPSGGQIGEIYFDPGISARGKMTIDIPDIIYTKIDVDINIDPIGGFKAYAKMEPTNIGPLSITGKGMDKTYGTDDDGALFYARLTPEEQRLYITSKVEIADLKISETDIELSPSGFKLEMDTRMFVVIPVHIAAETYVKDGNAGFRAVAEGKIGNTEFKALGNIGTKGLFLGGMLNSLTIKDLVDLANGMGANIPENFGIEVGFKDIAFYVRTGDDA